MELSINGHLTLELVKVTHFDRKLAPETTKITTFRTFPKKKVHSNDANKTELIWHARITPFELIENTPRLINSITNWLPEDLFFADFNFNLQKSNILVTVTLQYHPKYYDFFQKIIFKEFKITIKIKFNF